MTQAFPLQWPIARPRKTSRKFGNFATSEIRDGQTWRSSKKITLAQALRRLNDELFRLGAHGVVVSTNIALNRDGTPSSRAPMPSDPGVAVYFKTRNGQSICLPCDTYTEVPQNIAAIAKHIEATRAIERYGVASIAEMFTGFVAISDRPHWSSVLGVKPTATRDEISAAFRALAAERHPDKSTGSHEAMAELTRARDEALREGQKEA